MTKRASLAEEWFIEDQLRDIAGLCPACRRLMLDALSAFAPTPEAALHEVYVQSRAIRVQHVMSGQFDKARMSRDWGALHAILVMQAMISSAALNLFAHKPHLSKGKAR